MSASTAWALSIRLLHWLGAAAILFMLALGFAMVNLVSDPGPRFDLYQFHKSLGLFVLALTFLRILWRLARSAPPPIPTIPAWRNSAARLMHALLYGLAFAVALAGYASVSASSLPLPVALPFGYHAPNLIAPDQTLSENLKQAHRILAAILAICVAGHAGAALRRHFIDQDGTLRRMAPF